MKLPLALPYVLDVSGNVVLVPFGCGNLAKSRKNTTLIRVFGDLTLAKATRILKGQSQPYVSLPEREMITYVTVLGDLSLKSGDFGEKGKKTTQIDLIWPNALSQRLPSSKRHQNYVRQKKSGQNFPTPKVRTK